MAGAFLLEKGKPFAAGLCFAVCTAKPHLVVLLPLLLVAQNLRRTVAGLATGGAALLALSFAVGGWGWPGQFLHAIANPRIDPTPMELHNIRGLVQGWVPAEIALGLTVALAVWIVSRRAPFEIGLSAVLAGSLLVCHHLTASDWCMLLPVGLILGFRAATAPVRVAAILLITPLTTILQHQASFLIRVPDLLLLGLVYAMAYEAWRLKSVPA
jgi:hypothetical protein